MTTMKLPFLTLITTGTLLTGGCATSQERVSPVGSVQTSAPAGFGYDDRQIARIKLGETTEARLLEWFGPPESRNLQPDGRAQLAWSLNAPKDSASAASGLLHVSLAADGKVDAYSARRGPSTEHRTVEFVEKSQADMRRHLAQWAREGWSVLSVSARLPQADGTVHRQAELSRTTGGTASGVGYNDRRIAEIRQGQTAEAQLVEWFGPPHSRDVKPDGRAQLAWKFASRTNDGPGHSGELSVSLAPDGKVEAYAARRGPES